MYNVKWDFWRKEVQMLPVPEPNEDGFYPRPTHERVASRTMVLIACAIRSWAEINQHNEEDQAMYDDLVAKYRDCLFRVEAEPHEEKAILSPLGSLSQQERINLEDRRSRCFGLVTWSYATTDTV
jgi:hypothetical protein